MSTVNGIRNVLAAITKKPSSKTGKKSIVKKSSVAAATARKNRFMAQLLPDNDSSYLVEFHSDNCDHCEQMEPVLQRLEEDLQTKIRRINIDRRREFYSLMEAMGHDECGGLPFYYNRRTAQAICGATSYANLKRWGTGSLKALFQDPPENMFEQEVDNSRKRKVGTSGFIQEKLMSMNARGKKKESDAERVASASSTAKSSKVASDRSKKSSPAANSKSAKSAKARRVARQARKANANANA